MALSFMSVIFIFNGCVRQPEVGYENVGRWTRIDDDFTEKNQFELDKNYCSGNSFQTFTPIYIPTTLSNQANGSYRLSGTIQSNNYNQGTTTSNFTGTATPYVSSGGSFANGFANGYAMMSNAMARRAAQEREDKIFNDCMINLGWEKISRETVDFTKRYYEYHLQYYAEIVSLRSKNEFKADLNSLLPGTDRNKIKEYLKKNALQVKYDAIVKVLEDYVSKNQDIEMTAKATKLLAKIYQDGLIVNLDYDKYMQLLIKSANLGENDAQFELANIYMTGKINDYVTFKAYSDISLKSNEKAIYYLKKVAQRHIPKDDEDALLLGNGRAMNAKTPFGLISKYEKILQARHMLGSEYIHGKYIEKNEELGLEYIKNAAERDLPEAKMDLALYYLYQHPGLGLTSNHNKVMYWLKRAILQHDEERYNFTIFNFGNLRLYHEELVYSLLSIVKTHMPEVLENDKMKKFFDYYQIKKYEEFKSVKQKTIN